MKGSANTWAIISAVAGVAALVIPIALFVVDRQSKALTVETISAASVADLTDPALSVLKLTYKGQPVSRVTTATIEVANAGTQPIEMRDFERPLVIRFDDPNSTLAVTVSEREPRNLTPGITLAASTITVSPLLLNPGDRFRLNVVLRGDFNEPVADARIAGIRAVSRTILRTQRTAFRGILCLVLGSIAIAAYGYLSMLANPIRRNPVALLPRWDTVAVVLTLGATAATLLVVSAHFLAVQNRTLYWWLALGTLILLCGQFAGAVRRRRIEGAYTVTTAPVSHDAA